MRTLPRFIVAAALLVAACAPRPVTAPLPPSAEQLAPGLRWWRTDDPRGPWRLTVVQIDLALQAFALRAVHAHDSLAGRERTSVLAGRYRESPTSTPARVAINADFFDLRTGQSENNQVSKGEWWVGRMLTDSPYDTYDNVHSQLAVMHDGRASIDRYVLDARAWVRDGFVPLLGVNHMPAGTYEGTALYTPRFGTHTPRDTAVTTPARRIAELPLHLSGARGDTLLYVAASNAAASSGTAIPANGAVLVAHGDRVGAVQSWRAGDTVRVWLGTQPRLADGRPPRELIGGWPRLLEAGQNVALAAAVREGTISRNAEARHPRSAVALSRDGRTMWLVVVDGRSERSVGMTLVEMAEALQRLGAWHALNFDGGGSTTLVIDGRVVNAPTDATGERAVGNALLVLQRR